MTEEFKKQLEEAQTIAAKRLIKKKLKLYRKKYIASMKFANSLKRLVLLIIKSYDYENSLFTLEYAYMEPNFWNAEFYLPRKYFFSNLSENKIVEGNLEYSTISEVPKNLSSGLIDIELVNIFLEKDEISIMKKNTRLYGLKFNASVLANTSKEKLDSDAKQKVYSRFNQKKGNK